MMTKTTICITCLKIRLRKAHDQKVGRAARPRIPYIGEYLRPPTISSPLSNISHLTDFHADF